MEAAGFDRKTAEEVTVFLIDKVKSSYELKCRHEDPQAVRHLERYIILNAIDRLWQEHLYAMDSLREAVYLRAYGQKDPLVEYKTEAYEMFTELMANIKNEILHNLFRSTSNLMAFEEFLANLPTSLESADESGADVRQTSEPNVAPETTPATAPLPAQREAPQIGRNDPCPCGSGRKFKSCCGTLA
jgi:preprotein translocase subunit SecA